MPSIDWNAAIGYARLVQIAEQVDPKAEYSASDIQKIKNAGYTFLATIYGDDLATDVNPHPGDVVTFGFLAQSATARELVAVVRGTDGILEWLHDGAFLWVRCPVNGSRGMTEDGFTSVYLSLRTGRTKGTPTAKSAVKNLLDAGKAANVTVCGHSLGGALATLLSLDVALNTACRTPMAYTFASPRTGNGTFADFYNTKVAASFRVVNKPDLVPTLPTRPFYAHVDTEFELDPPPDTINPSIPCWHHLTTYLWLMSQQSGSGGLPLDKNCLPPPPPEEDTEEDTPLGGGG